MVTARPFPLLHAVVQMDLSPNTNMMLPASVDAVSYAYMKPAPYCDVRRNLASAAMVNADRNLPKGQVFEGDLSGLCSPFRLCT